MAQYEERECSKHGLIVHRKREGKHGWLCKRCESERAIARKNKKRDKAIKYLGGKCIRCGYNKCIAALDFHHRESRTKKYELAKIICSYKWDTIQTELDKCDLLCSNCHRELHYNHL
jgi:hypothetical protein